jgi:hypothetical protein
MYLSPHSLHPVVSRLAADSNAIVAGLQTVLEKQRESMPQAAASGVANVAVIPLTTVSLSSNFDAYVNIQFRGQGPGSMTSLLVDSGNSLLIVPSWEEIQNLPGYAVLGEAQEPWGSPAKVVRGPIQLPTSGGGMHVLDDCVFYACTGAPRTANFGVGCITPWSSNGWGTPQGLGVTMQAPLSYNGQYPFAEFDYAPAVTVFGPRTRRRLLRNRS